MKIQSINSFERINISKKSDKPSSEISTEPSLSMPETMQAFKAYAVASPNFKNLSMPIEVTNKYNKKVEGKDHLDLPNIRVYEYPDTNLRVMVNNIEENQLPQVLMYTELEPENYDSLKQALLNQIMFSNFKKHNLENYYNFDLHSKTQMISTDSENPLNISDLKKFSSILTNVEINEDNLKEAKEDLINYIQTPEYKEKTQFANSLYKNELIDENEFKQILDSIKLEDIKNYYRTSLENSEMGMILSINKQNQEVMNILSDINKGVNNKFKGNLRNKNILLNDEINYVYTKGNIPESKLYYTVDDTNLKNDTIIKIISKLENRYSNEKQEKENDYINKKLDLMNLISTDREIYFNAYKKREEKTNFLTSAGNLYLKGIEEPLNPNSQDRNLYGNFYTVSLKNDDIAVESKVQKQQEFFKELLNRDLKDDIEQIKNNYKSYVKYSLLEDESTSVRNLSLANLDTNAFQIYETVDSITEQDVKDYIETYFVNQPPVVEIVESNNENNNEINFKGQGNLLARKQIINKTKIGIIDRIFAKHSLPVVSIPILLYMKTKKEKITSKLVEESNNTSDKTYTTNYEKSVEDLKNAGVTGNYDKYINSTTGRPNIGGQNKIDAAKTQPEVPHKGAPDDMEFKTYEGEYGLYGELDNDVDYSALDNIQEVPELEDMISEINELDTAIGALTDIAENPLVAGVAAELLPGTRFLKPVKDLAKGDFAKAIVGAGTRVCEIGLAPFKLACAAGGGITGGIIKIFDPKAKDVGFLKTFKELSNLWAQGRDSLENALIGRENSAKVAERKRNELKKQRDEKIKELEQKKAELQRKRLKQQENAQQKELQYIEAQNRQEESEPAQSELLKSLTIEIQEGKRIQNKTQALESKRAQQRRIKREERLALEQTQAEEKRRQTEADIIRIKELTKQEQIEKNNLFEKVELPEVDISYEEIKNTPYIGKFIELLKEYCEANLEGNFEELLENVIGKNLPEDVDSIMRIRNNPEEFIALLNNSTEALQEQITKIKQNPKSSV